MFIEPKYLFSTSLAVYGRNFQAEIPVAVAAPGAQPFTTIVSR